MPANQGLVVHLDAKNIDGSNHGASYGRQNKIDKWSNLGYFDPNSGYDELSSSKYISLNYFNYNTTSNWADDPDGLSFDGLNDYLEIAESSYKNISNNNAFTAAFLINLGKNRSTKGALPYTGIENPVFPFNYQPSFPANTFGLYVDVDGSLIAQDKNTGYKLSPNKWYHIVYLKDENNTASVFVNGNKIWSRKITSVGFVSTKTYIGTASDTYEYLRAKLANFKLYCVALTDNEIKKQYDSFQNIINKLNL